MEILFVDEFFSRIDRISSLLDMRDLVDEERTMEMAEQYSNRRVMVRFDEFFSFCFD